MIKKMKQILIISGKGGTGKTIFTGALVASIKNKIIVDCDVDAANLHLLLNPTIEHKEMFKSGVTAQIDLNKCTHCGTCKSVCRFDAIKDGVVDTIMCEGCGFCARVCPQEAITMRENETGEWMISQTKYGKFIYAELGIGEENSGKLIAFIKQKAIEIAKTQKSDWIIIDGPPGIGCPVIASLPGIDLAVVVTEPTKSGLADMKRVIQLTKHFKVPVQVIINKYDLNQKMTNDIERFCFINKITCIGKIPFNKEIVQAMIEGKIILEYSNKKITKTIKKICQNIIRH